MKKIIIALFCALSLPATGHAQDTALKNFEQLAQINYNVGVMIPYARRFLGDKPADFTDMAVSWGVFPNSMVNSQNIVTLWDTPLILMLAKEEMVISQRQVPSQICAQILSHKTGHAMLRGNFTKLEIVPALAETDQTEQLNDGKPLKEAEEKEAEEQIPSISSLPIDQEEAEELCASDKVDLNWQYRLAARAR